MVNCLWCRTYIPFKISLSKLLAFKSIEPFPLCVRCKAELLVIESDKACPSCSRSQNKREICKDCIKWQVAYPDRHLNHHALFTYEGLITDILYDYKYRNNYQRAEIFSQEIKRKLKPLIKNFDFIVPIPSSQKSLSYRGYNPVEGLLETADITYDAILINQLNSKRQAEKDRKARMESEQPFFCVSDVKDKRILLVDDVYTTGRTLLHAYDVLEEAGAACILTFSLAR